MTSIELKNLSVEFPVYNVSSRSFKKQFLRLATGGRISSDARQAVVVKALSDINITFEHGDRIGLIGHNGAGKSTMLRVLAGIYEPTRGSIHINGHVSAMLDLMQGMETELTGYDNILMRGALAGLSREQITSQMKDIAELTGLGDYLAMPIRTYSSGMVVRLAFAISTSLQPEILLIDEIFGAGDADFVEKAKARMVSLLTQSNIVVMANHSDDILKDFCTKGVVMEGGTVKYFGPIKKAISFYHHQGDPDFLDKQEANKDNAKST